MANGWRTFPRTGFMIAVQNQVISTSNYKKCILNDPDTISKNCPGKYVGRNHLTCNRCMSCTGSRPLHHLHNEVANTFHQIWLSNADCQRDHQCRIINMSHSPYYRTPIVNCTLTSLRRSFHAL